MKNLISDSLFERNDAGVQRVLADSRRRTRFLVPFCRAQKGTRLPVRRTGLWTQTNSSSQTRGRKPPSLASPKRGTSEQPTFPQRGEKLNTTLTPALSHKRARELKTISSKSPSSAYPTSAPSYQNNKYQAIKKATRRLPFCFTT